MMMMLEQFSIPTQPDLGWSGLQFSEPRQLYETKLMTGRYQNYF